MLSGDVMYVDFEPLFRQRLVELRSLKDISSRDLSLSLGQSDSYINKIENGKMLPSMGIFFCICNYFNIHPRDFFDDRKSQPELIQKIDEKLLLLTDEQLSALSMLLNDIH